MRQIKPGENPARQTRGFRVRRRQPRPAGKYGSASANTPGDRGARLTLNAPDLDKETAEKLLEAAHQVCAYAKATRGNIEVALKVA